MLRLTKMTEQLYNHGFISGIIVLFFKIHLLMQLDTGGVCVLQKCWLEGSRAVMAAGWKEVKEQLWLHRNTDLQQWWEFCFKHLTSSLSVHLCNMRSVALFSWPLTPEPLFYPECLSPRFPLSVHFDPEWFNFLLKMTDITVTGETVVLLCRCGTPLLRV